MPPAATVGMPTSHPGMVGGPGVPTVLIAFMPAANMNTVHICAMPPAAGPHPPTPFVTGSATVLIGGAPAVRQGDSSGCGATVVMGVPNVQIG
ncbi:MAG TPA: PAAR domain-containing protein [Gemmatimonadaceae bacterium]